MIWTFSEILSIAARVLLKPNCSLNYIDYARKMLLNYVQSASLVYGTTFTTYNVHSLIHLADDVENHGEDLNKISAFPFENYLQEIKRFVKNSHNPIAQIVKRVSEIEGNGKRRSNKSVKLKIACDDRNGWFL